LTERLLIDFVPVVLWLVMRQPASFHNGQYAMTWSFSVWLVAIIVLLPLVGCSPDEMEVSIVAGSISNVVAGHDSKAEVNMSFINEQDSVKEKLPKIREIVKPYLGKSGKLTMRGDKITANFKVPFGSKDKVESSLEKAVAKLVLDNGRLQLQETPYLKALNRDLAEIDFSIDIDLKAKHLVYKIVGDESTNCMVKATAVFVDGEPHVHFAKQLTADDSVDIEFRCDTDASVWHQITPYIEIK